MAVLPGGHWRCSLLLRLLLAVVLLCAAEDAKRSYYEVLDVPKDADTTAVKKAYKKAALKWHPDKNPGNREEAEQKFRELAEAYEVLSDPEKRKRYDNPNEFGGAGFGGFDFGDFGGFQNSRDIFKDVFGTDDPFADFEKFFEDIQEEVIGRSSSEDKFETMVQALSTFYSSIGETDKSRPEKVKDLLLTPKWKGKEGRLPKVMRKKYADPKFADALNNLERVWPAAVKTDPFGGFGGGMGGGDPFGGFGGLEDMMNFGGGGGGGGAHGGSYTSFSYSSSSMGGGGKTVKTETTIKNGKRVTKHVESDGKTTQAVMEEEEGGTIKRRSGKKQNQLPGHEEM